MSFPLPSYPLHKKGLMIAEMVATLENRLAHAKRKADDAIHEKNMLADEVRNLKQGNKAKAMATRPRTLFRSSVI
jgi:hypothetical protein